LSRDKQHHSRVKGIKNKTEHHRHRDRKTIDLLNVQKTRIATDIKTGSGSSNSSSIVVQSKQFAIITFLLYIYEKNLFQSIEKKGDAGAARGRGGEGGKVQDHAEQMDINDTEVIDLCTPVNDIASEIVTTNNFAELSLATTSSSAATAAAAAAAREQMSYKSRTLTPSSARHLILPAFPASIDKDDHSNLLLANVPGK
jgi:hypothetical protein